LDLSGTDLRDAGRRFASGFTNSPAYGGLRDRIVGFWPDRPSVLSLRDSIVMVSGFGARNATSALSISMLTTRMRSFSALAAGAPVSRKTNGYALWRLACDGNGSASSPHSV